MPPKAKRGRSRKPKQSQENTFADGHSQKDDQSKQETEPAELTADIDTGKILKLMENVNSDNNSEEINH